MCFKLVMVSKKHVGEGPVAVRLKPIPRCDILEIQFWRQFSRTTGVFHMFSTYSPYPTPRMWKTFPHTFFTCGKSYPHIIHNFIFHMWKKFSTILRRCFIFETQQTNRTHIVKKFTITNRTPFVKKFTSEHTRHTQKKRAGLSSRRYVTRRRLRLP